MFNDWSNPKFMALKGLVDTLIHLNIATADCEVWGYPTGIAERMMQLAKAQAEEERLLRHYRERERLMELRRNVIR